MCKNLRIQKLRDAGTKKLYKPSYHIVSMATFFEVVKTPKKYSPIKFLFVGLLTNIPNSNSF